jgi:hypothetical protein
MNDFYATMTFEVARASAAVANYCDHAEHNEPTDREWVTRAGQKLRLSALEIAAHEDEDLFTLYATRLHQIEHRNPLWSEEGPDGRDLVLSASNWRELQLVQSEHDRYYHPDVVGLAKLDQLRHYALHVAKLTGVLAELAADAGDHDSFRARRLPDLALFGVKLSTVTGECLQAGPLRCAGRSFAGAPS